MPCLVYQMFDSASPRQGLKLYKTFFLPFLFAHMLRSLVIESKSLIVGESELGRILVSESEKLVRISAFNMTGKSIDWTRKAKGF